MLVDAILTWIQSNSIIIVPLLFGAVVLIIPYVTRWVSLRIEEW